MSLFTEREQPYYIEHSNISAGGPSRHIGIDYSGAETPLSSLKGLRVYAADRASPPFEVPPPPGLRKYWSRRGIAEWLTAFASLPAKELNKAFTTPELASHIAIRLVKQYEAYERAFGR